MLAEQGGAPQLPQQVGETLSYMAVLRKEIADARERRKFVLAYDLPPRFTEWLAESRPLARESRPPPAGIALIFM